MRSAYMPSAKGEEGMALVETALVIGLLVLALLGIISFGLTFHVQHTMVNAAREGARALAVQGSSVQAANDTATDALGSLNLPFAVTVTDIDVNDPNSTDVSVEITAPLSVTTFGLIESGDLRAFVTMRKEGGA